VIAGDQFGRKMGFPTANLMINDATKFIPHHGVYAVRVKWKNQQKKGMLYIGKRPTTHTAGSLQIEVNLFDFEGELYGEQVWLEVFKFIREDIHFENAESLQSQIQLDQQVIKEYFDFETLT